MSHTRIDGHNHFVPKEMFDFIRTSGAQWNMEIIEVDGKPFVRHFEGFQYPMFPEFYDYEAKVKDLESRDLDKAILSIPPSGMFYWVDKKAGLDAAQMYNDCAKAFCDKHPERFPATMASVPMQDVPLAIQELDRAHTKLGLTMVEIAPVILEKNLDEPEYLPFYEYCAEHAITVYLHPYYIGIKPQFKNYYNTNLIANVLETNMGLNALVFGGVFEKFPNLKVLASHGGGYFPYQFGRLMHGYAVRPEPKLNIPRTPEHYLKNIYYDTITHSTAALQFLVDTFGADHVCIGTDCPYDMGDPKPMVRVNALKITDAERKQICNGTIESLLGCNAYA